MKQKKPIKIKRYDQPFAKKTRKARSLRKTLITVGVLALLFGAGFLIARPSIELARSLIDGHSTPEIETNPQPAEAAKPEPEAEDPAEEQPAVEAARSWAYLNWSDVATPELAAQTAAELAAQGVQHAVLTLKDWEGNLYYQSAHPAATTQSGYDAAAAVQALRNAGLTPVARIYAFRDGLAPRIDRDMAVWYDSEGTLWLNNSAASGGVPWLNPFADGAVDYVSTVMNEVLDLGFEECVVAGLQFPEGYGLDMCYYGGSYTDTQKADRLAAVAQRLEQEAAGRGARCWFEYGAAAVADKDLTAVLSCPLGFGVQNLIVDFGSINTESAREEAEEYLSAISPGDSLQEIVFLATMEGTGLEEQDPLVDAAYERGFTGVARVYS